MPTEDESQLTLKGRATAAAGAAFVAAAIVNPLDVIKVGGQQQHMPWSILLMWDCLRLDLSNPPSAYFRLSVHRLPAACRRAFRRKQLLMLLASQGTAQPHISSAPARCTSEWLLFDRHPHQQSARKQLSSCIGCVLQAEQLVMTWQLCPCYCCRPL